MTIIISGQVRLPAESREKALQGAYPLIEEARAESGCIAYNWSADLSDPELIYVFEEWTDADSLAVHFDAPSYHKMLAHLSSYSILSAETFKYQVSDKATVYNSAGVPSVLFTDS
jgi:quinol monooxygenase YgiN